MLTLSQAAVEYARNRQWAVFPLQPRKKLPATADGFKSASVDPEEVERLWSTRSPDCNIGLRTGPASRLFVLDVDAGEPKGGGLAGPAALAILEARHGALPDTRRVVTSGGGFHVYFAWPEGRELGNRARITVDGQRTGLDCRADGGYVVLPPSVHPSGSVYRWATAGTVTDAPAWLLDLLDPPKREKAPGRLIQIDAPSTAGADRWAEKALRSARERIQAAPEGARHEVIYRESAAIGEIVAGGSLDRATAESALVGAGLSTGKDQREVTRAVGDALDRGAQSPRLPRERPAPATRSVAMASPGEGLEVSDDEPPPVPEGGYRLTDVGNAERLVARFKNKVRWCTDMPGEGVLVYDGARWEPDRTRRSDKLAKAVAHDLVAEARTAHVEANEARARADAVDKADPGRAAAELAAKRAGAAALKLTRWAEASEMGTRLREMVTMARSEVAVRQDELDADLWALNTQGGIVDLRTGEISPHHPDRLLTKVVGATAGASSASAPTWLAFLSRIMGHDLEMVAFLQRVLGYCLTGSTREQCLFVLHGSGSNGKSTFLDTVRTVLGDYAMHTRAETFVVKEGGGGIPNDVAALRGARVVTASEIKQGARLDESLIKEMTGDSAMTARFMRGEFFTFSPAWKMLWAVNHRPVIRGTDHGIWRRMRLIPFEEIITDAEKDPDLALKLQAERDGILAWMIEGCRAWQAQGLAPPARVLLATKEYRDDMDILKDFLDELCDVRDGVSVGNTDLYKAFSEWASENGEREKSQRWFSQALHDRGFRQDTSRNRGRRWSGLTLRPRGAAEAYSSGHRYQ